MTRTNKNTSNRLGKKLEKTSLTYIARLRQEISRWGHLTYLANHKDCIEPDRDKTNTTRGPQRGTTSERSSCT